MEGYRTIIFNALVMLAAIAAAFGIVISQDETNAVVLGIIAAGNIILRIYTTGKVFFRRDR